MLPQIFNDGAVQADRDVGPAHARSVLPVQLVLLPVGNVVEVAYSGIVVVLTREDNLVQVLAMHVRQFMLVGVPTAKAHIQTAHEGNAAINEAKLFVVSPVENDILVHAVDALDGIFRHLGQVSGIERQVLERRVDGRLEFLAVGKMIGVTEYGNIFVEVFQMVLGVMGGNCKSNQLPVHAEDIRNIRVSAWVTSLYTIMFTRTPRCAAANSIRSSRYCSCFAGGRLRYSSGESHPEMPC